MEKLRDVHGLKGKMVMDKYGRWTDCGLRERQKDRDSSRMIRKD